MKELELDLFFETSAKSGEGVVRIFEDSAKEILEGKFRVKDLGMKLEEGRLSILKVEKKGCC